MSSIAIAFVSLAVVGVVLVLIYSWQQNRIHHLEGRLRKQEWQSSLFSSIIQEANDKGVAPDQLKINEEA